MATENITAIDVLNNLLVKSIDSMKGYDNALDNIDDSKLEALFKQYARQRATFTSQIAQEIRRMGGEPTDVSSFASGIHRSWMDLKSALSENNLLAVLQECQRGEKIALQEYQDALEHRHISMPPETRTVIEQQHGQIRIALRQLQEMEGNLGR